MAVAVFNLVQFLGSYPEFTPVNTANPMRLPALFGEAGLYLNNTDCSPVCDVNTRGLLLNMLTAHISFLRGDLSNDGQARPVGRVSQASEGSVSASLEYKAPATANEAWCNQSQYGAAFWAATTYLRTMRYVPPMRWGWGAR